MDQQFVTVHLADSDDSPTLAVVYPPARIAGTDDPALVRLIRDVLASDTMFIGPDWRWTHGQVSTYTGLAWAIAVLNALGGVGLRGEAIGYTWPVLDHPDDGRVY